MSASISPTRCPSFDRATARLTATVVFPTPPLPEPTATILETPGNATGWGMAFECAIVITAPSSYCSGFVLFWSECRRRAPNPEMSKNLVCLSLRTHFERRRGLPRFSAPCSLRLAMFAPEQRIVITPLLVRGHRLQFGHAHAPAVVVNGHKYQVGAGDVQHDAGLRVFHPHLYAHFH